MLCSECKNDGVKPGKNHEGFYIKCPKCGEVLGGFDTAREARAEWNDRLSYIDESRFSNGVEIMPSKGYKMFLDRQAQSE